MRCPPTGQKFMSDPIYLAVSLQTLPLPPQGHWDITIIFFCQFPSQNSHNHRHLNMVFLSPSSIFSPTATQHQNTNSTSCGFNLCQCNAHCIITIFSLAVMWPLVVTHKTDVELIFCPHQSVRACFQLICQLHLPLRPPNWNTCIWLLCMPPLKNNKLVAYSWW